MVFSADDRILIKVLRQEKGYGAKNSSQNFPTSQIWGKLQERVYRSRIHDVDQLKSRLIEEWEHFHQMKWSGSGVHVFQLAFEHTEGKNPLYFTFFPEAFLRRRSDKFLDILQHDFRKIW